jgi:flagellar biosynthesis protein
VDNSFKTAVAIAYEPGSSAPSIIAKGNGILADKIISEAKRHGIAIHESKELTSLLMSIDLDSHIPPELYRAVAELLAWIYQVEKKENT